VPFAILYIVTSQYYSDKEIPDLIRLGYIPDIYKDYRKAFPLEVQANFEYLSKTKRKSYKLMTIGDSFSEQNKNGYKNYLSHNFDVLHIDRFISGNPVQTLINLINGDFFDNFKVEYVILQNVERHIIDNVDSISIGSKFMLPEIDSLIKTHNPHNPDVDDDFSYVFFSRLTLEFPLYYLPNYFIKKNYLSNRAVHNYEIYSKSLFSNNSNKLLFYQGDLLSVKKNNLVENIQKLNSILNQISRNLEKRNIKLIVLPAPDKYDLYYDYIINKNTLPKPLFYSKMKLFDKHYIYIDCKEVLSKYLNNIKDIYYYDDTHWSPIGAKIIADKIKDEIIINDEARRLKAGG
jgi:hypothetical protein